MSENRALPQPLRDLFVERGLRHAEPGILQSADLFLDLSGEDIRRRLLLVQSPDGTRQCLRPDYTIPVSRRHLDQNTSQDHGGGQAGYWYHGPIFRFRPEDGPVEIHQAGIECYGDLNRAQADADTALLAIEATAALGVADVTIRMGDPALIMAAVRAFGLAAPWQKRLRRFFARSGGLKAALQHPTPSSNSTRARLVAALAGSDHSAAATMVEDIVGMAGITSVGGRSAGDIAERLLEQSVLEQDGGLPDKVRTTLLQLAAINGAPEAAIDEFAAITRGAGIDINADLARFAARADAMRRLDRPILFAADFGRRLDYYSGFVFEIQGRDGATLVGGGRYDGLLTALGARGDVAAVGFAMWMNRLRDEAR